MQLFVVNYCGELVNTEHLTQVRQGSVGSIIGVIGLSCHVLRALPIHTLHGRVQSH
jgi:hypothetical protein